MAAVIAVGVRMSGEREILGTDVGPAEDHQFWLDFLRQVVSRGLRGVRLVTSDSHLGLKQAVAQVLTGATWQRCRVHFMRNALATVPKAAQQMVAATLRTIFAQPDRDGARETIARISRLFERRFPKLVAVLQEAEVDTLAFHSFPLEHRRQIWSTNALERLNREVGRRCDVVGIFPNRPSLLRLVGAVLEEQNDEWAVGRRYFSQESMNKLLESSQEECGQSPARAGDRIMRAKPHGSFGRPKGHHPTVEVETVEGITFFVWRGSSNVSLLQLVELVGSARVPESQWRIRFADCAGEPQAAHELNELVETLYRGLADNSVGRVIDTVLRVDLVILDELGFAPLDATGSQLFFRFIAAAYERRSLGIASHWPFDQWGHFLPDETTAVSMIDRILHHAVVVVTEGESFRMKEAQDQGR
jgi:hypothetical protein